MSLLSLEVQHIQNPALGAALVWRFATSYAESEQSRNSAPLPLVFIVLPMLLHAETQAFIKGTNRPSGLRIFAAKFGDSKNSKEDILLALHNRVTAFRLLTLDSIRLGMLSKLFVIGLPQSVVIPLSRTAVFANQPKETRQLMRDAEKLGDWCAQLSIHEIATTLKLRF